MITLSRPIKLTLILLLSSVLSACASWGHLNYKQARMLKKEGFVLTDEGWSLRLPERLLFGFDSYEIKAEQTDELTRLSTQLQKYKLNKIKIVGHTDDIGNPEYNQKLSEERAQSVASIFVQQGFKQNDLTAVGRGSSQPFVPNTSDENRANNRRVAVIIIP